MSILSTEQVSHSFNDKWLFNDLHFALLKGDRIALVGINGTGKSTLLKILSELIIPTKGRVVKEKGLKIGYLPQEPNFSELNTINDFIYSADNEQQQLIKEYEQLVENEDFSSKKFLDLTEKITAINAWEYENNIRIILNRFQITNFDQKIDSLSGGQKKRLALAKLLIDEPDIYVLDEPTNHLDIETIEWLEKLLTTGNKTVLLVSHDRYFLDNVCTEIRELDQGSVFTYKGNYGYFLEKKAEREATDVIMADKARNLWKKELEWMRRQPKARGTKSKSRIESFYDLEEKSKGPKKKDNVELSVKVSRQGSKILEIDEASVSFGNKTIISSFSYVFKKGDRIGLAGGNGSGKSTFLNLITGNLQANSGIVSVGETTKYGYYKQEGLSFNNNERVLDIVKNVADYIEMKNGEVITASQLLTKFLFPPEKQFGMVSKLSGGEKKRLLLMRVLMANPNFLILDEPSNDLDIDTLNVLEDFLETFPGILILVSHDRYLLDKLTDQLFIFKGDGEVVIYNGNYADYKIEQEILLKKADKKSNAPTIKETAQEKEPEKKQKLSYKEIREYETLESEINLLEEDIKDLTDKLSYTSDHIALQELAEKIDKNKNYLEEKSERWLKLSEYM